LPHQPAAKIRFGAGEREGEKKLKKISTGQPLCLMGLVRN